MRNSLLNHILHYKSNRSRPQDKTVWANRIFTHYCTNYTMYIDCAKETLSSGSCMVIAEKTHCSVCLRCCYIFLFTFITPLVRSVYKIHKYGVRKIPKQANNINSNSNGVMSCGESVQRIIHCRTSQYVAKLVYVLQEMPEGRKGSIIAVLIQYSKSVLPF
jgi:hypothetical protein